MHQKGLKIYQQTNKTAEKKLSKLYIIQYSISFDKSQVKAYKTVFSINSITKAFS